MTTYESLLRKWCERLLDLQIKTMESPQLKGGLMCPSCSRIHGRCFDAIYPFMYLADKDKDERYLTAAKQLFDWAQNVTSRPDGSFVNDTNSDWKGITVFTTIQLAEALKYHGHILDEATYLKWKNRIAEAAQFLYEFKSLEQNNVNYKLTNSLAMHYCGELLNNPIYTQKAKTLAFMATEHISESGILFGEGRPTKGYSPRGCRPVDIGYNVEESLPSLALYSKISHNTELQTYVEKALAYQLKFMLDDGGFDNSFGTRNFKWTYWGSRTSDGCALGYLLFADENPSFATAACKNLELLEACTHDGLLHGGPGYFDIGEPACSHHTFAHAKVLASILDHGLESNKALAPLPRTLLKGAEYFPDIDTYQLGLSQYTATVTAYDWEYLKGGHASGGALTLIWHQQAGPLVCASMSEYSIMKEPNNMQLPKFAHHECLTPRIEFVQDNQVYSNVYDFDCHMTHHNTNLNHMIKIAGTLVDADHTKPLVRDANHQTTYTFSEDSLEIKISLDNQAKYVLSILSKSTEKIAFSADKLLIHKPELDVSLTAKKGLLTLPYEEERIYNLVPGFEALKIEVTPVDHEIILILSFHPMAKIAASFQS